MEFKKFAEYLEKISNTSGRTDMTIIVSELFKELKGDEIKYAMYLIQGRLVPKFVNLEFNISQKLILRALGESIKDEKKVNSLYRKLGDTGLVAESLIKDKDIKNKDKNYSIEKTYKELTNIAKATGKGSQDEKMNKYFELINSLDSLSAKFATRIIIGNLRLGISDKTILDSLSWFKTGDKSLRSELDYAFGKKADIGELAETVIDSKENLTATLNKLKVQPGTPVASKLVEREKNSKAIWERMSNCYVQPKLDGLRGQLHYDKKGLGMIEGKTAVFSRNMETMTDQFPELTESLEKLKVDSIILDSEIIGVKEDNNKNGHPHDLTQNKSTEKNSEYLTYQETMQRKRKYDIGKFSKSIPVRAMCFDILYLNREDLTQKPIEDRIKILSQVLKDSTSSLRMLETKQVKSEEELQEYFTFNVKKGLEGIITKELGTNYDPGTRNFKWIKLKANTRSDLVDTIDVVVLGYYTGKGDRARFGFGALLAGVYDPKEEKYYSIGKVGSGFTEEQMGKMFKTMEKIKVEKQPENVIVEKMLYPDVWVKPEIIMEIIADEITRSPAHTAARGKKAKVKNDDSSKGLSIRFPRMKIWNRDDKDYPNTVGEIIRMYELRKG